ncbi:GGDEF domain-containing protein [Spirochaeta isovalerica]|uniref:diguanylate cyclase n=1 Tax=Spirochaeta isovalerica TaxID=150 RepID=A0A841R935_9SPIO|nr:GGDEF domain-containing protein [Spirochaeta isovalerica]MBB6479228.1 diguanylate cyclase (GGDEF)-like protein [Spirochaeta isovalerica]
MACLVLYIIPAFIIDGITGNFTQAGVISTIIYYGFIAFLFIFLRKGHIHFVTTALLAAGFLKALEYFFVAEAFVFYIHISLALIVATSIHVRKYQLYLGYFLFNLLIVMRIPYVMILAGKGVLSEGSVVETAEAIFGSLFITLSMNFLSQIIDREIENSVSLEKIASTDTLTGLLNRRKLENSFRHPGLEGINVLMEIDLDFFKKVNDDFGHEKGDDVLVQFSSILSSMIRESDSCYRWGGEEFVVLLNELSIDEALAISERLRVCVAGTDFGLDRPMTISIGVAAKADEREPLDSMFRRADKALYRAKESGRNKVEVEAL